MNAQGSICLDILKVRGAIITPVTPRVYRVVLVAAWPVFMCAERRHCGVTLRSNGAQVNGSPLMKAPPHPHPA